MVTSEIMNCHNVFYSFKWSIVNVKQPFHLPFIVSSEHSTNKSQWSFAHSKCILQNILFYLAEKIIVIYAMSCVGDDCFFSSRISTKITVKLFWYWSFAERTSVMQSFWMNMRKYCLKFVHFTWIGVKWMPFYLILMEVSFVSIWLFYPGRGWV